MSVTPRRDDRRYDTGPKRRPDRDWPVNCQTCTVYKTFEHDAMCSKCWEFHEERRRERIQQEHDDTPRRRAWDGRKNR